MRVSEVTPVGPEPLGSSQGLCFAGEYLILQASGQRSGEGHLTLFSKQARDKITANKEDDGRGGREASEVTALVQLRTVRV